MSRKTILTAALALAAAAVVAFTPSAASAVPPTGHGRPAQFGRYGVLVLRRGCWDKVAAFRDRFEAQREARQLRLRGFEVKVERC